MKQMDSGFGLETIAKPVVKELRKTRDTVAQVSADPESKRTSGGEEGRVEKEKLRLAYMNDPLLFNGINEITRTIFSGNWEFTDAPDNVLEFFNEFRNGSNLDTMFEDCVRYFFIYGDSWMEKVKNENRSKIVDVALINSEEMDYKKEGGAVMLDEKNNPTMYVQTLPRSVDGKRKIDLEAADVIHFKFNAVGDGFYGIGLIEPIYRISLSKVNMEDGLTEVTIRLAYPKYWGKVGDKMHEPTPDHISELLDELTEVDYQSVIVTPYFYDIGILEPKQIHILREHLEYLNDQECAGMGVPKPYVTMRGEKLNKATLDNLNDDFERNIRDYQRKFARHMEQELFKLIAEEQGFDEYPLIKWGRVDLDSVDNRAVRLVNYVKNGLISAQEVEKAVSIESIIREEEGLPQLTGDKKETPKDETDGEEDGETDGKT